MHSHVRSAKRPLLVGLDDTEPAFKTTLEFCIYSLLDSLARLVLFFAACVASFCMLLIFCPTLG